MQIFLAETFKKSRVCSIVEDKYVCKSQVFWAAASGVLGLPMWVSSAARHMLTLGLSAL